MSVNSKYPEYVELVTAGKVVSAANPLPTSGGGGGGGGGAVTIVDGGDVTLGAKADAAATTDAGTFTLMALVKRLLGKITTQFPAALTGGGNLKVALAETTVPQPVTDNGGSLTVDGSVSVTGSVTITDGSGPVTVDGTVVVGSSALPTGAATETTLGTRLSESDFDTKIGSLTEAVPASDTASSGLNGRVQRVAQRLTSLINLFPASLGTKTAANSLSVSTSSDDALVTLIGAVNETAPASDTASSGLNGRIQRACQRLTSLISLFPSALVGGRLDVNTGAIPGTVSANNSSTATLGGGAVFTGTGDDVTNIASIFVSVFTDQASATGGLSVQFSPDNTNWDHTRAITVSASSGMILSVSPAAKFFRVVYTNGATPNTVFRLQTLYRQVETTRALSVFQDVNGALSPSAMGQRVFSDGMVQDATGNSTNRIRSARDLAATPSVGATFPAAGVGVHDGSVWRPALGDTSGRQIAVGAAAAGSALAGNPIQLGISDGTNIQALKQAVNAGGTVSSPYVGVPGVVTYVSGSGGTLTPQNNSNNTGDASNGATFTPTQVMEYNGATRDLRRNNIDATSLTSGSRTTTQTSADITTYNLGALKVILDMTVVTATPSVTLSIEEKDATSGKYTLLLTGAAITTISTNEYTVDPAIPAVANVSAQKRVARVFRIIITANNANAGTYSSGYKVLPAA